jgi:hypothetical protein
MEHGIKLKPGFIRWNPNQLRRASIGYPEGDPQRVNIKDTFKQLPTETRFDVEEALDQLRTRGHVNYEGMKDAEEDIIQQAIDDLLAKTKHERFTSRKWRKWQVFNLVQNLRQKDWGYGTRRQLEKQASAKGMNYMQYIIYLKSRMDEPKQSVSAPTQPEFIPAIA